MTYLEDWTSGHRDYQHDAILRLSQRPRGTCLLPTGTGKTRIQTHLLVQAMIDRQREGGSGIYVVGAHRLLLCRQLLNDVVDVAGRSGVRFDLLFVGSDRIDEADYNEEFRGAGIQAEYGTSEEKILAFVEASRLDGRQLIVVCTYHSFGKMRGFGRIDVCTFDEAHTTTESRFMRNISSVKDIIDRQYFFTATKRIVNRSYGMADESFYGPELFSVSPKEMIDRMEIVPPIYHLIRTDESSTYAGQNMLVKTVLDGFGKHKELVKRVSSRPDAIGAKMIVTCGGIGELREIHDDPSFRAGCSGTRVLAFHSGTEDGRYPESFHVDFRRVSRKQIIDLMDGLGDDEDAILLHVGMLTEGINLPSITGVLLLRNLQMTELIQTIGRAMRLLGEDRRRFYSGEICREEVDKFFSAGSEKFRGPINALVKPCCFVIIPESYSPITDNLVELMGMIEEVYARYDIPFVDMCRDDAFTTPNLAELPPITSPDVAADRERESDLSHAVRDICLATMRRWISEAANGRDFALDIIRDLRREDLDRLVAVAITPSRTSIEAIIGFRRQLRDGDPNAVDFVFDEFHREPENNRQCTKTPARIVAEMCAAVPAHPANRCLVFHAYEFVRHLLRERVADPRRVCFVGDNDRECRMVSEIFGCEAVVFDLDRRSFESNFADVRAKFDSLESVHTGMKFDIVIGNPPYQEPDRGHGASARPIYHKFVEKIVDEIDPDHFVFIIPAKWYVGGKEPRSFRERMMADQHIRTIRDFSGHSDIFGPDVKIRGGTCWFHRDKSYDGPCNFNGQQYNLAKYEDVIVRRTDFHSILDKTSVIRERISDHVMPRAYFGVVSATPFELEPSSETMICHSYKGRMNVLRSLVKNHDAAAKYKVMTHSTNYCEDTGREKVIFKPWIMPPDEVSSETFIVLKICDSDREAHNFLSYSHTKFFRFLTSLRIITHHNTANTFAFVPRLDYSRPWNDPELYEMFELTGEEIAIIESSIASYT